MNINEVKNIVPEEYIIYKGEEFPEEFTFVKHKAYKVISKNQNELIVQGETGTETPLSFEYILNNFDLLKEQVSNKVDHPSHYTWLKEKCGIEVIDITRHLDFDKGNAIKYILRSGYKEEKGYTSNQKEIEDIKKAIWYLNDKLKMLEK